MQTNDHNAERRAAKNRRLLLGRILTGQAKKEDIRLDREMVGFIDFGTNEVRAEGETMTSEEFEKRAGFFKDSRLFKEIVVVRDKGTGELVEVEFEAPLDDIDDALIGEDLED